MEVRLKVQGHADRIAMVCALAHSGYKVWVEEKKERNKISSEYFVIFEYERQPTPAERIILKNCVDHNPDG